MKGMIFAAGLGTRLMPLTANKPKALIEYKGKTLLQHAIEKLTEAGIDDIIVNVHHFADQIIKFVTKHNFDAEITISDERDALLDTGGGLKKAAWFFDKSPFLAYNVDIISNIKIDELIKVHSASKAIATLAVKERESSRKLMFDENFRLCGWANLCTNKNIVTMESAIVHEYAFSGIQILDPEIFKYMPAKRKFSVIELYLNLASTKIISGYLDQQDFWLDLGRPEHLNQ
ncbi:MAG: nucleotidyltransferase family protein [Bacteroidetes bacterium]|nr:nucleotidyltransferase family protein [Bacteroidota bacterium]